MRVPWSLLVVALLCGAPASVLASTSFERALHLTWDAPNPCPGAAAVRSDVRRLVGPLDGELPMLVAEAHVSYRNNRWQLTLSTNVDGTAGERELEGTSCEAVAESAAVLLALALNPKAPLTPAPDAEESEPSLGLSAGGVVGVGLGAMPSLAPELGVAALGSVDRFWLALAGTVSPRQQAHVEQQRQFGGRLWLGSLRGSLCWDALGDALRVSACGEMQVQRIEGLGTGVENPDRGVVWWTSAGAALVGRWLLAEAWELQVRANGSLSLARPRLFLDAIGEVHRPAGIATSFGVQALYRIE